MVQFLGPETAELVDSNFMDCRVQKEGIHCVKNLNHIACITILLVWNALSSFLASIAADDRRVSLFPLILLYSTFIILIKEGRGRLRG